MDANERSDDATKSARSESEKFRTLAGRLFIVGALLIEIVAVVIHWMIGVAWLAFVCFLIGFASYECAKDAERKKG